MKEIDNLEIDNLEIFTKFWKSSIFQTWKYAILSPFFTIYG